MNRLFLLFTVLVLFACAFNVVALHQLESALGRIERSEQVVSDLMIQYNNLVAAVSQCDEVILQRQNDIISEIKRLDHNQHQLIDIVAPEAGDTEESE